LLQIEWDVKGMQDKGGKEIKTRERQNKGRKGNKYQKSKV
jgi:hypothetical protein